MEKYVEERDKKYLQKLRDDVLPYLPNFCYDYFISISTTTTILTRYNYGTDLRVFFDYLISPNACLHGKDVKKITIDDMKTITNRDIERFIDYISGYYSPINGNYVKNSDRAKTRKLSAIRTLFKYLYNNNYLPENVASKVKTPKLREKVDKLGLDEFWNKIYDKLIDNVELLRLICFDTTNQDLLR